VPAASTVGAAMISGTRRLREAGIGEEPRAEARRLLEAATGLSRERLLGWPGTALSPAAAAAFARAVERRAAREPLAYVTGRREFYGLSFKVVPGVLVPRPETETLVDAARARFPDPAAPMRVLDIGVGTGCLLLTVLSLFPNARGIGTDLSDEALACAAANAESLGLAGRVALHRTSWATGVEGPFDLVLSNPPYVAEGEIAASSPRCATGSRGWRSRRRGRAGRLPGAGARIRPPARAGGGGAARDRGGAGSSVDILVRGARARRRRPRRPRRNRPLPRTPPAPGHPRRRVTVARPAHAAAGFRSASSATWAAAGPASPPPPETCTVGEAKLIPFCSKAFLIRA
jgi:release factor glutamine methyltransferase